MRPAPVDLFGEVPVTLRQVEIWLYKVPRLPAGSTKRAAYTRQWNVVEKLRRAVAAGTLETIIPDECCEFCGQVLAQEPAPALPGLAPSQELALLQRRVAVLEALLRPGVAVRAPASA